MAINSRYQEMLEKVDLEQIRREGCRQAVARDARCENCMVHCGYDPSGALTTNVRDTWKNMAYNFGAKPKPYYAGKSVNAFNGFSPIGKGHLAEGEGGD